MGLCQVCALAQSSQCWALDPTIPKSLDEVSWEQWMDFSCPVSWKLQPGHAWKMGEVGEDMQQPITTSGETFLSRIISGSGPSASSLMLE